MRIKLRKIAATVLLLTMPVATANASLQGALDGMWMSNVTAAQGYSSDTRVGLYGGSMVLRAPIKTYNVMFFDPPRIKAGCNGIDMYFGAFSFISGEQLTQLLRNIATAAVPYFFELAIKTMCPTCANVMAGLRKLAADLSNGELNSCKIGQGAAAFAADKIFAKSENPARQAIAKEAGDFSQAVGTVSTWWDNFTSIGNDVGKLFTGGQTQTNNSSFPPGTNATSNALVRCNAMKKIGNDAGFASGMSEDVIHDMILSITGTTTLPKPTAADEKSSEEKPQELGKTIDFKDLIDMPAEKDMWTCGGSTNCDKPTKTPAHNRFKGTRKYVNKMLFGNEGGAPATGGIVQSLIDGQAISVEQQAFIGSFKLPVASQLLELQSSGPNALHAVATVVAGVMEEEMAVMLGRSFLNGIYVAQGCDSKVGLPEDAQKNANLFSAELTAMSLKASERMQTVQTLTEVVAVARKFNLIAVSARGY